MSLVKTSSFPLPGALRLRALQPLSDRDGSCSLIYDLERAAVLDVPEDLQFHIAPALETGDLDEDLVSWLMSEDLLTAQGSEGWGSDTELPGRRDGRSELASLLRLEDEFHGFIDRVETKAVAEALDLAFKSSLGASRIILHIAWDGVAPDATLVELLELLTESCRRAVLSGQEISYELTVEASQVIPELVSRLSGYPVRVRLRCGRSSLADDASATGLAPWLPAEGAARLLLEALGSQVSVQCTLEPQDRLADLWTWAKRIGIQRLDVLLAEESNTRGSRLPLVYQVRELRGDLLAICQEMAVELSTGGTPIDFEPLTRTVRRLIRHEACGGAVGLTGLSFERSAASLWSFPELSGFSTWMSPSPIELEAEPSAVPCASCWARYACSHSAFVSSPIREEDPREPSEERCASWKAEVEAALHLYHALAHIDPMAVLHLFAGRETSGHPTDRRGWIMPVWSSKPS